MFTNPEPRDSIVLAGLKKSYGQIQAVRGVDDKITLGGTVGLLGPNGAGKSTTIVMRLGLARPDAGTVTLFVDSTTTADAAGRVGGML